MFKGDGPHIFALPPGADFPTVLVAGLREKMAPEPPEAMARVTIFLNTERMRRKVVDIFTASGAGFLPKLLLVTELGNDPRLALPLAVPALRRRLELSQLISGLLDVQPDLAPRAALYDLSDSLATLMDEMQGEGVLPATIAELDVSNHSDHWARTKSFLQIISPYFLDGASPDADARQRMAVLGLTKMWQAAPPRDPIIIAGSTGSRGTTALLMQAVCELPQGALVLPGYDFDLQPLAWLAMNDAMTAEDHPQYRYRRLMDLLHFEPQQVQHWQTVSPPSPARNQLISLSLRPAPVTDQWLIEGPKLPDLIAATNGITLIEAPSQRTEALAIAMILREAAENGTKAALISPDRNLTRQVTAALDRWSILPDDSGGRPLGLSAPGRFLRHVAGLFGEKLTADQLLIVLKHPLAAAGVNRGSHLLFTRALELSLRKHGPAFPKPEGIVAWAGVQKDQSCVAWANFIAGAITDLEAMQRQPLIDCVSQHRIVAERFARGTALAGSGELWEKPAGIAALTLMNELAFEAHNGGSFSAVEYRDLFTALINKGEVREAVQAHPNIMIWGTLEARVQGAELVILGGLNDSIWPKMPEPDAWLNRDMRKKSKMLLPERQVGLSAHDYQQAIAAPRVVLTRAARNADAETVPSRWLNRLTNLMSGLPGRHGPEALQGMRDRGKTWLNLVQILERPTPEMTANPRLQPAHRPAPQPPVSVRPDRLSLTRIERLIRDPYAIYAQHILRLRPLDPLRQAPNARDRGVIVHAVLEQFVKNRPEGENRTDARRRLMLIAQQVLTSETPFPAARALWMAKLDRAADHFLTQDSKNGGIALAVETEGSLKVGSLNFTLFGTPDRIDRLPDGTLQLIDYKTGSPPSKPEQTSFAKQLRLAAIMAEKGGFSDLGPSEVSRISYIGLGSGDKAIDDTLTPEMMQEDWTRLIVLIGHYLTVETGYASRRAVMKDTFAGDYDHLARYGEWQMTDRAVREIVGQRVQK